MRGTVIKVNTKEFILITENKLVLDNYVTIHNIVLKLV